MKIELPADIAQRTAQLSQRATSLRAQAADVPGVLAQAYRRRAAELEMEAWALEVRSGVGEPIAA